MRQYSIESMLKGIHNIEYKIEELKKKESRGKHRYKEKVRR